MYCLLKCPLPVLRKFASVINYEMLLDEHVAQHLAATGDSERQIKGFTIPHDVTVTTYRPFEEIFGKYDMNLSESLYWRPEGFTHEMRPYIRLMLLKYFVEGKNKDGGCEMNINKVN